ncbi:MAG: PIN domain-containing protein [Pseudomonadota bacterium]
MILVDTSIWIDHLRAAIPALQSHLERNQIASHPHVIGEIGLGSLRDRVTIYTMFQQLPQATVASHEEVLIMIETHELFARGIGYVDAHLLASTRLTPDARLWTRDRRLETAAQALGIAFQP